MPTLGAVTIAQPTAYDGFLAAAEHFLIGARVLAAKAECAIPFSHLCGHVAECLFKTFLSTKGVPEDDLKKKFGHQLSKLRAEAVAQGLAVPPTEPQWLTTLNRQHGTPYRVRYPIGLHGIATPEPQAMLSDLEALHLLVQAARS